MNIPLSLVKGRVYFDSSGIPVEIPVLIYPGGIVYALLDYFLRRRNERSNSWMRKVSRAVVLFIEYISANKSLPHDYRLFIYFAQRLGTGTIDPHTGEDISGLGWTAIGPREKRLVIYRLTEFFRHVSSTTPDASRLNPIIDLSSFDMKLQEAAYLHRRQSSFLGHTWEDSTQKDSGKAALVRGARPATTEHSEPPRFPEEHFLRLLLVGFKTRYGYNYRDILITLLQHGGGVRESEPFHLFISDVSPNPYNSRQALVHIHHPIEGAAPTDWTDLRGRRKQGNRGTYLRERWGILPRNSMFGGKEAGWKGGAHQSLGAARFYRVHWFIPEYGELFLRIWYLYLQQVLSVERNHPFAFVNLWREPKGAMYALSKYNQSHEAAVRRIGLNVSKREGTTRHGHRHAYGKRAERAGLGSDMIRRMMHHTSLESQSVYTVPDHKEIEEELSRGLKNLEDGSMMAQSIQDVMLSKLPPAL